MKRIPQNDFPLRPKSNGDSQKPVTPNTLVKGTFLKAKLLSWTIIS